MKQYSLIHCHTDFSNGVTNIDSVTKYTDYIDYVKNEPSIKGLAITEHGNVFEWYKKKKYCEENGLKYIHAMEAYITETDDVKVRDNYHFCLYALNTDGFHELNRLSSRSFNRKDGHYYYAPRITLDELFNTSDNIVITTACLGGIFKSEDVGLKERVLKFLIKNKHRCYLEIQHHLDDSQKKHNELIYKIHKQTSIPMIVGTDTHSLNNTHSKGRTILQYAKDIFFHSEDGWDITVKNYEELIKMFDKQGVIAGRDVEIALNNTNIIVDLVNEYVIDDTSKKYPKLYKNPLEVFDKKIEEGINYRGIKNKSNFNEYIKRINEEKEVYKATESIDYMLLQNKICEDGIKNGIMQGYGRGSATGSLISYLLKITEMDSVEYDLNFFRFISADRVTNADIDIDYQEDDRDWIKKYIFNMEKLNCADIITFNTVGLKGGIRDVGRAFKKFENGIHAIPDDRIDEICKNIETKEKQYREQYPLLFEYVDIISGTIVSVGSHASGVLVSDLPIDERLGLCSLADNPNPVVQLSMKPLDSMWYVKLDCLGLDSIGIINETCKLENIDRLTPDNIDLYDDKVWEDIRQDTTAIFQMESSMAHKYFKDITNPDVLKKIRESIPNIKMFDLFMFISGAIRPAGENFRDDASKGIIKETGFKELDEFLHDTLGYVLLQEQIMQFLVKFCGYSGGESDIVRRAIAKKGDTTPLLKEIRERFLEYSPRVYNISMELAQEVIEPILLDIKSASGYGFSDNHNHPYAITGYAEGWLRYYYPVSFITSCLNTWSGKEEKMVRVTEYANKKNITINPPQFGYSKGKYHPNKETNSIYKGIGSIKYLNQQVGDDLFELSKTEEYPRTKKGFLKLLIDMIEKGVCNSRQIDILIRIGYFSTFGKRKTLLNIYGLLQKKYKKTYVIKTKIARITQLLIDIEEVTDEELPISQIVKDELEYIGYISMIDNSYHNSVSLVTEVKKNKWGTPFVTLYRLCDGATVTIKTRKGFFEEYPLKQYDTIKIHKVAPSPVRRPDENGKWVWDGKTYENILEGYGFVRNV